MWSDTSDGVVLSIGVKPYIFGFASVPILQFQSVLSLCTIHSLSEIIIVVFYFCSPPLEIRHFPLSRDQGISQYKRIPY